MSQYLMNQFDLTRNALLGEVNKLDESVIDVQPEGFNNNIHWHVGHILTVTEQFLFGFPEQSQHIPENYMDLFGNGTKPADWVGNVPAVADLAKQLTEQLERIKQIPAAQFDNKLEQAILGQDTFGGLATLAAFHEANHIGQLHAIQFAAKASKK